MIILLFVYFGDKTTKEAEKSVETFENHVRIFSINASPVETLKFLLLMTQIRSRKLKIRNIFFVIDWNVVLAVSQLI